MIENIWVVDDQILNWKIGKNIGKSVKKFLGEVRGLDVLSRKFAWKFYNQLKGTKSGKQTKNCS